MQEWFVRTYPTKYPDLFEYDVLEKSPVPEKYQGHEIFGVASGLDSKENAYLIAAAPDLLEALKLMLQGSEVINGKVVIRRMPSSEAILAAWQALIKAEGM